MRTLRVAGLWLSLAFLPLLTIYSQCPTSSTTTGGGTGAALPAWPDASRYWGVLLNTGSALLTSLTLHPANFAQDYLVTDYEIVPVDYTQATAIPTASATFSTTKAMLDKLGIAMGRYISGTNVEPFANQDRYPYGMVRQEDMPGTAKYIGNWGASAPWRLFIDPSDAATTTAFHNRIAADWAQLPDIHWRFVDNAASLEGGTTYGAFADQMANVHAINLLAQSQGARAIFNTSVLIGLLSPTQLSQLISAVAGGGICLESPWGPHVNPSLPQTSAPFGSADATANAKAQYRQILDYRDSNGAGIGIVMIGAASTTPTQATSAQLKAWVGTWRKPTDHLYMARNFYQAPDPAILDW